MTLGPSRRIAPLALLLALAACAGGEPAAPETFAPLSYAYLTPLHLDVASLAVEDHAVPQGPDDVADRSPAVPAQVLEQMAHDRIFPGGGGGTATFVVDQASILRHGDRLDGRLAVHLDLGNGRRSGHAEAQVSRSTVGGGGDLRARLYALTRQMMDDMNVEFEYQVRHSLSAWLQPDVATPGAVTAQPLSGAQAPLAVPSPSAVPAPVAPPAPASAVPSAAAPDVPATSPTAAPVPTMSPPPGFLAAPAGMQPTPLPSAALPPPTPLDAPATSPAQVPPAYAPPGYVPPAYTPPAYTPPAYLPPTPSPAYAIPAPTY